MYKATVNDNYQLEIDTNNPAFSDLIELSKGKFHLLKDHKSYNIEVVEADPKTKLLTLKVNGNKYTVELKDKMDLLLENMGISKLTTVKVNEIKAPMPGLVLDLKVAVGDTLAKGDTVIVLEAMKMENVLQSPGEGVVKSIEVEQGQAVEKGQVMIRLD